MSHAACADCPPARSNSPLHSMDLMIRRWLGEDAEDIVSVTGKTKLSLASHRRVFWD